VTTPKYDTAPRSYGSEPEPSPGWHVVPDIGEHDPSREAYEAGNGYALVMATMERAGYVLPVWIAEAWRSLSDQCMSGKLTWNEALAPKAADGHKVKVRREHKAYMDALQPLTRYRHHRISIAIRQKRGGAVDDPLEGLPKDSAQFKKALGDVMGVTPATALDVYNRVLPKAERYPSKSRKRAVRKGR